MASSPSASPRLTAESQPDLRKLQEEIESLKRHLSIVIQQPSRPLQLSISNFKLDTPNFQLSRPFYSQPCGHRLCLRAEALPPTEGLGSCRFVIQVCLMQGEFDSELAWPVKGRVTVTLLNQSKDCEHIQRSKQVSWQYRSTGDPLPIPVMTNVDMATIRCETEGMKYVVKNKLQLTVKYMTLEK